MFIYFANEEKFLLLAAIVLLWLSVIYGKYVVNCLLKLIMLHTHFICNICKHMKSVHSIYPYDVHCLLCTVVQQFWLWSVPQMQSHYETYIITVILQMPVTSGTGSQENDEVASYIQKVSLLVVNRCQLGNNIGVSHPSSPLPSPSSILPFYPLPSLSCALHCINGCPGELHRKKYFKLDINVGEFYRISNAKGQVNGKLGSWPKV